MGKSRSATCCAAYLMKTYRLSPKEAVEQIRQVRPIVEPNEGFMQQLELYYQMDMTEDVESSPIYQRWTYHREIKLSRDCRQAPDVDKIRFEDEHVSDTDKDSAAEFELKCRKCR
jgi:dual specificity phosphatase 12